MKQPINEILKFTEHRTWNYPTKDWSYYQEWNNALFFHYEIDKEVISEFIPKGLELDLFNNKAWISIVAFKMEKIRPKYLPPFPPISNFGEINVRTYVTKNNKPGVYFISIEAEKLIAALLAKKLSGLPYEKSTIKRTTNTYKAKHPKRDFSLYINYTIGKEVETKTDLAIFLTERYCLYLEEKKHLYIFEIQHLPWKINELDINSFKIYYKLNDRIVIDYAPSLVHYSEGVQVIAWNREKLD